MKNPRTFAFLLAVAIVVFSGGRWMENPVLAGADPVFAQESWKSEFEDVCSKTQDAMELSAAELNDLIVRCDKLKPLIETLDETQRKVYLKRLGMCRDLFVFVKESKEKK
jgi:hypothetical protein